MYSVFTAEFVPFHMCSKLKITVVLCSVDAFGCLNAIAVADGTCDHRP